MKRLSFFYGWVIVVIAICSTTIAYGIRHSFSVFFPPILDEFGWGRGSTAIMLSLNLLVYAVAAPVAGSIADRWKPRKIVPLGATILIIATASCAFAHEQWHFYLLFGVIAPIGTAFCGFPLFLAAVTNWFVKRRGLIIGIAQLGGGLSFTYGLLVQSFISAFGWRTTFLILAGLVCIVLLPLSRLFYYRPEDKGLTVQTVRTHSASDENITPAAEGRGLKGILTDYRLWCLVLCEVFYWGIGSYLVLAHQVKYAIDAGFTSIFAASVFALFGVFTVLGQLSSFLSDLLSREKTIVLATLLAIGGIVSLLSATDSSRSLLLYIYAITFGYATGLYSPTVIARAADLFHGKHIGTVLGLLFSGMGVGGAIGPWLGGFIYDTTGSYTTAFYIVILSFILAAILFFSAAPRKSRKT